MEERGGFLGRLEGACDEELLWLERGEEGVVAAVGEGEAVGVDLTIHIEL